MSQQTFFEDRLIIIENEGLELESDVLVNFCGPNILTGKDLFAKVHEIAGPELKAACEVFIGAGVTTVKVTDAFEAKNFKKIAHVIIPATNKIEDCHDEQTKFDLSLAVRNVLDVVAEAKHKSILFYHPFLCQSDVTAKIIAGAIKSWLEKTPYAKELSKIVIVCHGDASIYGYYIEALSNPLKDLLGAFEAPEAAESELLDYNGPIDMRLFESLIQQDFYEQINDVYEQDQKFDDSIRSTFDLKNFDEDGQPEEIFPSTSQYCMEKYGFDEAYIAENSEKLYDELFKCEEGIQLQLSRNLSPSILTIEEDTGFLRQYRMTTQNRDGDTSYFRCSRCESLMRLTNSEYRPKITVKNGYIFGDCYPSHHPQCLTLKKYDVIIQQMDREARMWAARNDPNYERDYYSNSFGDKIPEEENIIQQQPGFPASKQRPIQPPKSRIPANAYFGNNHQQKKGNGTEAIRGIGGETLEAIRKCEDELDTENYGTMNKISEEEFHRTMVGDLHGNMYDNQTSGIYETEMDEAYIQNQPMNLDPNDLNQTEEMLLNNGNTNPEFNEYPNLNYTRGIKHNSNLSYRIPYPDESESYNHFPEEEESAAASAPLSANNKIRKYRIIRLRRRTNATFEWNNDESNETKLESKPESNSENVEDVSPVKKINSTK